MRLFSGYKHPLRGFFCSKSLAKCVEMGLFSGYKHLQRCRHKSKRKNLLGPPLREEPKIVHHLVAMLSQLCLTMSFYSSRTAFPSVTSVMVIFRYHDNDN
ncbi:hypothetical protein CHUAL_011350 [Chamberlinius hualienensis]